MKDNFLQRKKETLSKIDKSSKKKWDKKILSLCEKINSLKNYYTTSSCSGRVALMIDKDKKEKDLFIRIYHELISFSELKKDLDKITRANALGINRIINKKNLYINKNSAESLDKVRLGAINERTVKQRANYLIKFKQEPCILHAACRSLEDAQNLLDKAKLAGWKKSGIIASGKRFVVELNSTEKLEFPIISNSKILVDDKFLKIVVKKSNDNLKKSWEKIERFEKSL